MYTVALDCRQRLQTTAASKLNLAAAGSLSDIEFKRLRYPLESLENYITVESLDS